MNNKNEVENILTEEEDYLLDELASIFVDSILIEIEESNKKQQ
jgi:hypothetical protein